jgi:hypothetical protein
MKAKTKVCLVLVTLATVAAAVGVPWFLHARKIAQRNVCLNNLRQIDCVQCCCVPLANNLSEGDIMNPKDCFQYIKGATCPVCPAGGQYIISYVVGGPYPKCTVHGDFLQEVQGNRQIRECIRRKSESDVEYKKRMVELEKKDKRVQH